MEVMEEMFNPKNSTEKGQRCTYKKKERKKKKNWQAPGTAAMKGER